MDCEKYRISCQLEQIADKLTGFDTGAFISTLLATVIGAILALLGAWWLDRRRHKNEAKQRYEQRLDDALYRLVEELGMRMHILATADGPPFPPPSTLQAAANLVRMCSRDEDANTTKQMQYALDRIAQLDIGDNQRRQVEIVGQIIRAWREGSHDAVKATERFEGLCA